jgi:serine/threonine-protein kinase RsbW
VGRAGRSSARGVAARGVAAVGRGTGRCLSIVIPSQTGFLGLVREIAERVALLHEFDGATAQQVALAVDEATTNSIKHAYRGAADREIEVRFSETARELRIEVIDEGQAVDRHAIPRVDLVRYASEGRTGGLGVHLMGRIMDSVSFRRSSGRNVCCLRKRKPSPDDLPR